jgi:hypothetical protein
MERWVVVGRVGEKVFTQEEPKYEIVRDLSGKQGISVGVKKVWAILIEIVCFTYGLPHSLKC